MSKNQVKDTEKKIRNNFLNGKYKRGEKRNTSKK